MAKNLMASWLRDAHGLEEAKVEMLEHTIKDFKGEADVRGKLSQYLETSKQHKEALDGSIKAMDESESLGKTLIGKLTAAIPSFGTNMFADTAIKDLLVLHATAHFAHACYVSLASGAESGQPQLIESCMQMAEDEKQIAGWLLTQIPPTTRKALAENS